MRYKIDDHPGIMLKQIARLYEQVANACLKPLGITHAQSVILIRLWENEGFNQAELSKSASLDQSTVVRLLDRMEKDELIIRKKNPDDRRVFNFYLTTKSKKICQHLAEYSQTMTDIAHESFSENEFKQLKKLLIKIKMNIETHLEQT